MSFKAISMLISVAPFDSFAGVDFKPASRTGEVLAQNSWDIEKSGPGAIPDTLALHQDHLATATQEKLTMQCFTMPKFVTT